MQPSETLFTVNPDEHGLHLKRTLERELRYVLNLDATTSIAEMKDLTAAGLDSLRVMQLKARLGKVFGKNRSETFSIQWPSDPVCAEKLLEALSAAVMLQERPLAVGSRLQTARAARPYELSGLRKQSDIKSKCRSSYLLRKMNNASSAYVFLHGYMESAEAVFDQLAGIVPADSTILSLEAPMANTKNPGKSDEIGYFWYPIFGKPEIQAEFADFSGSYATDLVSSLLCSEGFKNITVIGFSQGGTIATKIGGALTGVRKVITIFSPLGPVLGSLRPKHRLSCEIISLLRTEDDFLDTQISLRHIESLKSEGVNISTIILDGREHGLDDRVMKALAELL